LLSSNSSNLQPLVLALLKDFMSVQAVECFGCVLTGLEAMVNAYDNRSAGFSASLTNVRIQENREATGMESLKPGDIINICVDDDPLMKQTRE
jgi:hypothetical protein